MSSKNLTEKELIDLCTIQGNLSFEEDLDTVDLTGLTEKELTDLYTIQGGLSLAEDLAVPDLAGSLMLHNFISSHYDMTNFIKIFADDEDEGKDLNTLNEEFKQGLIDLNKVFGYGKEYDFEIIPGFLDVTIGFSLDSGDPTNLVLVNDHYTLTYFD